MTPPDLAQVTGIHGGQPARDERVAVRPSIVNTRREPGLFFFLGHTPGHGGNAVPARWTGCGWGAPSAPIRALARLHTQTATRRELARCRRAQRRQEQRGLRGASGGPRRRFGDEDREVGRRFIWPIGWRHPARRRGASPRTGRSTRLRQEQSPRNRPETLIGEKVGQLEQAFAELDDRDRADEPALPARGRSRLCARAGTPPPRGGGGGEASGRARHGPRAALDGSRAPPAQVASGAAGGVEDQARGRGVVIARVHS